MESIQDLAHKLNGEIDEVTLLPDGSGFASMSYPLPENHWIYGDSSVEKQGEGWSYEPPPMPMRMGADDPRRREMAEALTKAAKYAVRAATMKGKNEDFDPDALIQNLIVGMLGYHTSDGLSDDEWANP